MNKKEIKSIETMLIHRWDVIHKALEALDRGENPYLREDLPQLVHEYNGGLAVYNKVHSKNKLPIVGLCVYKDNGRTFVGYVGDEC